MLSKIISVLVVLIFGVLLTTCGLPATEVVTAESPLGPDLVIKSFNITELDWFMGVFNGNAEVVVNNVGDMPTSGFDVGIVSINREDKYVKFGFSYDPTSGAELGPRQEVMFSGEIGLYWHGHFDICCSENDFDAECCAMHDDNHLWLMAIADFCVGVEVSEYCTVEEIDETNNTSELAIIERAEQ